jgi:hypothetical protein
VASAGGLQVEEEVGGECVVGRYIGRSAPGHGRSILIGKVVSYDSTTGVFGVVFEDGQGEDLGLAKLQEFLVSEYNGTLGMEVSCRKRKLDLLVPSGSALDVREPASTRQRVDGCVLPTMPDAPQQSASGSGRIFLMILNVPAIRQISVKKNHPSHALQCRLWSCHRHREILMCQKSP